MSVNTNPFGLSINMVSISITRKEQKKNKVPKWEKKLKAKDKARPSRKAAWKPKFVKTWEIRGRMLARR